MMYRTNRKKSTSAWTFPPKLLKYLLLKGEKGVSFGTISNTQKSLTEFVTKVPAPPEAITVAFETGTHSAWISRLLEARGYEVIVAHARDLLVKQRTSIVNAIRGFLRSIRIDDSTYSYEVINDIYSELPKEIQANLCGLFSALTALNNSIKEYDKHIRKIAKDYPETKILQNNPAKSAPLLFQGPRRIMHFRSKFR